MGAGAVGPGQDLAGGEAALLRPLEVEPQAVPSPAPLEDEATSLERAAFRAGRATSRGAAWGSRS